MNTPTIHKLKAAVAQFGEAFGAMHDCLHLAVIEAGDHRHRLQVISKMITDKTTVERIQYEVNVAHEDEGSLNVAWDYWLRISREIDQYLGNVENRIDEAACDALSFEDFKFNEAKAAEFELQRRRDNIRPMTEEERDCLVRKDLGERSRFETPKANPIGINWVPQHDRSLFAPKERRRTASILRAEGADR